MYHCQHAPQDHFDQLLTRYKERSCGNKMSFASLRQARKDARKGTTPYKCRFCGLYHLGHPGKGQSPGVRAALRRAVD